MACLNCEDRIGFFGLRGWLVVYFDNLTTVCQ